MNMKGILTLQLCVIFLSSAIVSGQQKSEWKGKTEYENGVKVIMNPAEPLFGEITFDLEEELSIGREDDENYMFFQPFDLKVDKDGNIYVLDPKNARVQKYDKNGNYLLTIGKKGQGPGEFERPFRMEIDDMTGKIYVSDMRRLKTFDKNGNYLKDVIPSSFTTDFYLDDDSNILCIFMMSSEASISKALCKLGSQGKTLKKYVEFPYELTMFKSGESVISVTTGHEFSLMVSQIDKRTFVYGYSKEYELVLIDKEGTILFKVKKDEPYEDFTTKEKQAFKRQGSPVKLPPHKPFFYSISTDSEGRIYTSRSHMARRGVSLPVKWNWDVYSKDGHYLYKARIPGYPFVINDGLFYTFVENMDSGEIFVKRFKIENWDQIKKGI